MYLLDTNICIYLMKHQPAAVEKKFESLAVGDVAIPLITNEAPIVWQTPFRQNQSWSA
jgi:predicted nucleic acid-binding protein